MIAMDALPRAIRESTRAVVWRAEVRAGRLTKVPYQVRRPMVRASVTDPSTWGLLREALAVAHAGRADGVGIVLGDGLVGVDLDHVRDPETGSIDFDAMNIVKVLSSYTEISPSGCGVHVLLRGALPPGGRRKGCVELYDGGRYFTLTSDRFPGTPRAIKERTLELAALHRRIFGTSAARSATRRSVDVSPDFDDSRLLKRARAARNGLRFSALWAGETSGYPSHSEADLALCNALSFWTAGDAARVDRLFRQSGLFRPKWDAVRGGLTYGERTIATALGGRG
jgi:primase-polymerase (primpol)-like protein